MPRYRTRNSELSPQEEKVAALVARGLPDRTIGDILDIRTGTVRAHVRSIFRKTNLLNRTQLAIWVMDNRPDLRGMAS